MNLEIAKIFCDLAELKNFSRTAELHGISQSAVSQQLAHLEIVHNAQLINRKERPPELTASGQAFYRACKDILERYDQLNHELATLTKTTCRVNIASIFSIGMHTMQPYIKKFMKLFPDVNLVVEYLDSKDIYERILKGSIDMGIVALPRRDRTMQVYAFENEPLVLACAPGHPFSAAGEIDIHRIQGEKFIAFSRNVPTRQHIDGILKRYSVSVQIMMEFDNIETIKRAIEINSGIGILPRPSMQMEAAGKTLVEVGFSNEHFYRPTGIIVRKDHPLNRAAQYLLDLMRKDSEMET
ncbi:MAG: LysR family transcriptional regulator [Planctomycetales bacterium]|nr:LysR family transcriptional regulator [Planctomycetales bacterium]